MVKSSACSECWSHSVCLAELCCVLLAWPVQYSSGWGGSLPLGVPVRLVRLCGTVGIWHKIPCRGGVVESGPTRVVREAWGRCEAGKANCQTQALPHWNQRCDVCRNVWALKFYFFSYYFVVVSLLVQGWSLRYLICIRMIQIIG